jgi:biopolymer transport protein ExbD
MSVLFGIFVVALALYAWHSGSDKPIIHLTIKSDLSLKLGGDVVAVRGLLAALEAATNGNHNALIVVRSAKGVSVDYLMTVYSVVESAGYVYVGFYTRRHHSPHRVPVQLYHPSQRLESLPELVAMRGTGLFSGSPSRATRHS